MSSVLPTSGLAYFGYYVTMGLGTPVLEYALLFDTGSGPLWVQCNCKRTCIYNGLTTLRVYHPQKSSTSQAYCRRSSGSPCTLSGAHTANPCSHSGSACPFGIQYDVGGVEGTLISDLATLPAAKGATIRHRIQLGYGSSIQNDTSSSLGVDGILGMQFGPTSKSLLYQFWQAKLLRGRLAYCMDSKVESGSKVRLGAGPTPSNMQTTILFMDSFYSAFVNVSAISVGNKHVGGTNNLGGFVGCAVQECPTNGGVLVDTGTSITALPTTVYNNLKKHLGGSKVFTFSTQGFDCTNQHPSAFPPIYIFFTSSTWVISPETYMFSLAYLGETSPGYCLGALSGNYGFGAIIGESWIQNSFVEMDFENRIFGFAPQNCATSTLF